MCGITGFMHFEDRPVEENVLKRMMSTLVHRGPDAEGLYIDGSMGLGHRRLAIIDLATGEQPLVEDNNNFALVFNGEIYNYLELRDDLRKRGHQFKTESDTEVVLKAYREWGVDCLSRFNGMWAFALWDKRNGELFLARDRAGEKPLYYSVYNGTFVFGSEAKALLEYGIPPDANGEMTEIYLTLGYIPAPYSFYKHIQKLESGHYLVVRNGVVRDQAYWVLPQIPEREMRVDDYEVCEEFAHLLKDSVKLRMRSDVPFGAFLSGGLDSSSIVALMAETSSHSVETFTIGCDEKAFDERALARQVASSFKTNHHEFVVQQDAFDEALKHTLYHYDEPFGDSSAIPTMHVSEQAGKYVKMVLTGDGGDEVLSGYDSYASEKIADIYRIVPAGMHNAILATMQPLLRATTGARRYKLNRMANVISTSAMSFEDRQIHKLSCIRPDKANKLMLDSGDCLPVYEYIKDVMKDCLFTDNFYKLMYFQYRVTLPERMLTKVDRMSMAHSLETRIPFLDYRLIELMAAVSKKVKMPGLKRKTVLRRAMKGKLPLDLFRAPKKGFSVPLREWFKGEAFSEKLASMDLSGMGLSQRGIRQVIDDNRSGKYDCGNFIWMLFLLDRWHRESS